MDAYLVVNHRWFGVNAEYVRSVQKERTGPGGTVIRHPGRHRRGLRSNLVKRKLHPYVRFDRTALPEDGGPYLSLREVDAGYTRVYVPESKAVMTGAAFDVNQHVRVKAEYIRRLAGAGQRHGAALQAAFGF